MERNRRAEAVSVSGVVLATWRQRGRNPSNGEDETEEISELRFGKRPKKDMNGYSASCASPSANSLNKRKRWGMAQDTQPSGPHAEAHVVKADDDGEPSYTRHLQKHVKSRVRSKEDKFFIDISAVPRKRRSSISLSSRLTSTARKHQDLCSIQQQSPVTTLNGSSLPYGSYRQNLRKKSVSDFLTVSDQEAEVAEALFVLASSTPSHAKDLDSKFEAKSGTDAKSGTPHQCLAVVQSSSGPDIASAGTKGKQPRFVAEKKEGKGVYSVSSPTELVHSSVSETELGSELQRAHSLGGEGHSFLSETSNSKILAGSPHFVPCWPRDSKETMPRGLEQQCKDYSEAKKGKQELHTNADMEERQPEVCVAAERTSIATQGNTVDNLGNHDEALTKPHLSSSSDAVHDCDGCISTSKIDIVALSTFHKLEALHENGGEISSPILVKENSIKGLNTGNGYLKLKGTANGGIQASNHDFEEQTTSETIKRPRDGDVKEEDPSSKTSLYRKNNGNSSVSSCFSSLSSTAVSRHASMGLALMSGFSQMGYHGSAATSSAATSSLNIDMKAAEPAMQLPHAAISSPVPKMKSCATHVYVAHYIHREQQASRHSLWSAALCRATNYNLNSPPSKILDNDRPREAYAGFTQKAQSHQTEPSFAYNISQSSMHRVAGSGSTHGSSVASSISASNLPSSAGASSETSTVTASGHAMAAHAQYLHMMMWQSGVASFPYLLNRSPGQPHLISHLQPLSQQAASVHKQQQAKGDSSSRGKRDSLSLGKQQQLLQISSQPQQQPQNLVINSASESSAHLETENNVVGESFPMDLSLMAPSGGGHIGKFQQTSVSLSSGKQQHLSSQNTFSSTEHQVKGLDRSFSSNPGMIGVSKQPFGPGLVSTASMMASECHGTLPGSYKEGHDQRTSHEAACVNEITFTMEGQGDTETRRVRMKRGAARFDLSKATVEPSSLPLHGPFFPPPQLTSLLEAKSQRHHGCSDISEAPSARSRVLCSASAGAFSASVSKGAPMSALESPLDQVEPSLQQQQALPSHFPTVEVPHIQQAGQAQQCMDPDSQSAHIQ